MPDLLLNLVRPRRIPPILLAANRSPLPQRRYILPQSICADLVSKPDLYMKATNLDVLLQDVLPHEAQPAESIALVHVDVHGEVVAAVREEAPGCVATAGDSELAACAAEVRGYCVCPFSVATERHGKVDVVAIECPLLVGIYRERGKLAGW